MSTPEAAVPSTGTGRFRVRRVTGSPVVAVRVWSLGGARLEPVPGLGRVVGTCLSEGTRRRDWRRIATEAETLGMHLSSSSTFESHGVAVDALADDWELALEWAAELLLEPSFPEARTEWACRQITADLTGLLDQPAVRAGWAFLEQLYAPHPRARPLHGTPESLASIGAADCRRYHRGCLAAGSKVTVAGQIPEEEVTERIQTLFGGVGEEGEEPPAPPAPRGLPEARREVRLADSEQAHLYLGHLTIPRNHPDYEALELAGVVLGAGAGLTGRIPDRIREREGLAYSTEAQMVAGCGFEPGRLIVYVGTAPRTVEQAERGVREELERLLADGMTEGEFEEARAYLLGREPFRRETARQWADLLAEAIHYGLPVDRPGWREERLRRLDRAAVEVALRRHLRPDELRVTVGLPG